MNLRIVSLNTFGVPVVSAAVSKRFIHMAEELRSQNLDIMCLQEVHLYPHLRLLESLLPEFTHVAYRRFVYGPKGGLVIFSKLPLDSITYTGFSSRGSFRNKSLVAKFIRNGVLSAQVNDQNLVVYNAHLTPNTDIDYSEENRFSKYHVSQLAQITEMIRGAQMNAREVVVTGDFNVPPESTLFQDFLRSAGLVDLFSSNHQPTSFRASGEPADRLDYIFISSQSQSIKHIESQYFLEHPISLNGKKYYISDHNAVMAHLKINPTPYS